MRTVRRVAAVLTFPAIAWLGVACERTDTPTGAAPRPLAAVGGPTCNVPADYGTIQAAVNDPGCSTIDVAPGAYAENVSIPRTLTLNGAQAGMPVAGRVSGGPLESTVTGANPYGGNPVIAINAASVTVDGFSLKNPITTGAATGIDVKTAGTGAVIANNIIDGVTTADVSGNGSAQAVYLENGPDNVRILGNDLRNVQSARSAKGVPIGDASSRNSIENITSGTRGAYGVSINNGNGATLNSGLVIRDNSITNLVGVSLLAPGFNGWVHAIGLEANTPGVLVTGNTISNLVSPPVMGFATAVGVWFEVTDPSYSTGHVNQNNLDVTIADYGIAVDPHITTGAVDGTCNWWGDPNGPGRVGPGLGAQVTLRVTFTPWLSAPAPNGACIGGLASTPGKVTGGGQIEGDPVFAVDGVLLSVPALVPSLADPNSQASFGFVIQQAEESGTPTGNLEYNDKGAGVRIKAISFDRLVISTGTCGPNTHAEFTGMATVTTSTGTSTEPLTVKVDDCDEPGTMDKFGITTIPSYSNGPSTLIGGNIQIH